jgi:hypothetical protein
LPEISRFFGLIIRMFAEPGAPHSLPHFHVYYQNLAAIYCIEPIEIIAGSFPLKQRRLAEAWAELHQGELAENWERLQSGRLPFRIVPLQ